MNMTQPPTPGLDYRALWLSLGGSTLGGLVFAWPTVQGFLTRQPVNWGDRTFIHGYGDLIGLGLIPILVTAFARRLPLLWTLLALAIYLTWTQADWIISGNWRGWGDDIGANMVLPILSFLVLCVPIAFVRFLIRRHREHVTQMLLTTQTPPIHQEGVWPPPPTRPPL